MTTSGSVLSGEAAFHSLPQVLNPSSALKGTVCVDERSENSTLVSVYLHAAPVCYTFTPVFLYHLLHIILSDLSIRCLPLV